MNLIGTFVGAHGFKVVGVAQRRVFRGDAVTTQNGAALTGYLNRDAYVVIEFGHRNLVQVHSTGIVGAAQRDGHIGQFLVSQVVGGQRFAKAKKELLR